MSEFNNWFLVKLLITVAVIFAIKWKSTKSSRSSKFEFQCSQMFWVSGGRLLFLETSYKHVKCYSIETVLKADHRNDCEAGLSPALIILDLLGRGFFFFCRLPSKLEPPWWVTLIKHVWHVWFHWRLTHTGVLQQPMRAGGRVVSAAYQWWRAPAESQPFTYPSVCTQHMSYQQANKSIFFFSCCGGVSLALLRTLGSARL